MGVIGTPGVPGFPGPAGLPGSPGYRGEVKLSKLLESGIWNLDSILRLNKLKATLISCHLTQVILVLLDPEVNLGSKDLKELGEKEVSRGLPGTLPTLKWSI